MDCVHRVLDGVPPGEKFANINCKTPVGRLSLATALPWFVSAPGSCLKANSHPTDRSEQGAQFFWPTIVGKVMVAPGSGGSAV